MATKYSLSYYRGSNIIEPITEMQEGFYSQTEFSGKQIRELQRMIEEDIYGCYLITGMRGVGKTSFMNVALSHTKYGMREKEQVIIRVNAVQMQEANELFPILIRELLRVVKKSEGRIKSYFKQVQMIDVMSKGTIKKSIREQWTSSHVEENSDSNKEEVNLGIGINSIFQLPIQIGTTTNVEREKKLSDAVSAETGYGVEYEVLENPQELFNDLMDDFEKSNIRLLVVLDEIDKCDSTFVDEVFRYYKDLLLNSKMFWFLVADEQMYQRYLGLKENILDTYFVKKIYLPLMTYGRKRDLSEAERTTSSCLCVWWRWLYTIHSEGLRLDGILQIITLARARCAANRKNAKKYKIAIYTRCCVGLSEKIKVKIQKQH